MSCVILFFLCTSTQTSVSPNMTWFRQRPHEPSTWEIWSAVVNLVSGHGNAHVAAGHGRRRFGVSRGHDGTRCVGGKPKKKTNKKRRSWTWSGSTHRVSRTYLMSNIGQSSNDERQRRRRRRRRQQRLTKSQTTGRVNDGTKKNSM